MTLRRSAIALLLAAVVFMSAGPVLAMNVGASPRNDGPTHVTSLSDSQLVAAHAPKCATGYVCQGIPCSQSAGSCGVVEAGPTQNLGAGQYVNVNLYNFTPGHVVSIFYCKDTGALDQPTVCLYQPLSIDPNVQAVVTIPPSGSEQLSFQTESASTSGSPFCGVIPIPTGSQSQVATTSPCGVQPTDPAAPPTPAGEPFFCDNGQNRCSIDVVDGSSAPNLASPANYNSVVFPVTFLEPSAACANAGQVTAESEFGFNQLFNATDPWTCAHGGAKSNIPFNTQIDGTSALTALASGATQVAFTDDPQSPEQQAIIKKNHFLLIPLAISANSISYRAQETVNSTATPFSGLKMSAEMVAQIMTGQENLATDIDHSSCSYNGATFSCSIYSGFNSSGDFSAAGNVDPFLRNDHAGPTGATLDWICAMKPLTLNVSLGGAITSQATEQVSAEQELKNGLAGTNAPTNAKGCVSTDQFPPLVPTNPAWTALSTVDLENLKLSQKIPSNSGAGSNPNTGVATMNMAVASYYGMPSAAVQNAAGEFVTPDQKSVMAGIKDGTWDGIGMFTPSYTNKSDRSAYPMPSVMYAAVPTNNMSPTDVTAVTSMLNSILDQTTESLITSKSSVKTRFAATKSSTTLPEGLFPLTGEIAIMAKNEVTAGIDNPSYVAALSNTLATAKKTTSTVTPVTTPTTQPVAASSATPAAPKPIPTPSSSPNYGPFTLTAAQGHLLVVSTVGGGIVLALLGIGLLFGAALIGRRVRTPDVAVESDGDNE